MEGVGPLPRQSVAVYSLCFLYVIPNDCVAAK